MSHSADSQSAARDPWSMRALLLLAVPLIIANSLQALIGVADAWFVARISAEAIAGLGAQTFLNLAVFLALGGIGFAVQTIVAQAMGAGDAFKAARQLRCGLIGAALTAPVFAVLALVGSSLFSALGIAAGAIAPAAEYWGPRMAGGPVVVAMFAATSFLAGQGRTGAALAASATGALANVPLNELFIFTLDGGIAGAAWASSAATAVGLAHALWLARSNLAAAAPHAPWLADLRLLARLGIPIGLSGAVDVLGIAAFQAMMARLGVAEAAATQGLLTLTGLAFWPALGVAMASTTLVGNAWGAGNHAALRRVSLNTLVLMTVWMGASGVAILAWGGAAGTWLLGPSNNEAVLLMTSLLVVVALYQVFDALNLGCAFVLRGINDADWAAVVGAIATFPVFLPAVALLAYPTHSMAPFPAAGLGVAGGWYAAAGYSVLLAVAFGGRLWFKLAQRPTPAMLELLPAARAAAVAMQAPR